MMKRMLAIIMIILLAISQMGVVLAVDNAEKTITVTHSIQNSTVTVRGSVSTGETEYLKMNITKKTGESSALPYETTIKKENVTCPNGEFYTEANGRFEVTFTIDEIGSERTVYEYAVSECLEADVASTLITENFDDGTANNTYSNSGSIVVDSQNASNKYYDMTGVVPGKTWPTYIGFSATAPNNGWYSIQADIALSKTFTDDRNLFVTANSGSSAALRDTTINNLCNEAYKVRAEGGALVLYCATNNTNQTDSQTLTLLDSFEADTWYTVKIEMNSSNLGLRVWVDGVEKCAETDKYIFAQQNYGRIFIADLGSVVEDLSYRLDNVTASKIVKDTLKGISPSTKNITIFGTEDYERVRLLVNNADANTINGIITNPENAEILGLDLTKYTSMDFTDEQRAFVGGQLVAKDYARYEDIKAEFDKLCIFADLTAATSADEFALKLEENELLLGIDVAAGFYDDVDVIGCAYNNLSLADTPDKLITLIGLCNDLYKLKTLEPANFASVEDLMRPYGWSINLSMCSDDVINALKASSASYVFTFTDTPEEILRDWVKVLNEAYITAKIAEAEYQAFIDTKSVTNNKINITGHVSSVADGLVPPVGQKFIATAVCGNQIYSKEFMLDEEGKYNCDILVENTLADKNYTVTVKNVKPDPIPEQIAKIDFYGDEVFSGRGYETKVDIVELDATHSTVAKLTGKSDSECYVDSGNKLSPRLLYANYDVAKINEGLLCVELDFMMPENTKAIIHSMENTNGKTAIEVNATYEGALTARYYNSDYTYTTITLLEEYETNKWYSIKYEINMASYATEIFIDDECCAKFTLSKKETAEKDFGALVRLLYSQAYLTASEPTSKTHYLDNFIAYMDKAERIKVCEVSEVIPVYGQTSVLNAVNAVADAVGENCITQVSENNNIFEIDFESNYSGLSNKQPVWDALTELERTATVTDIRNTLYGEVALQKMKESLTADERVAILAENSRWIGIELSDVMVGNSVYTRLLNANVNNISDCTELRTLCDKIKVVAQMQTATVLTVSEIVDDYVELLENKGLTTKYKELKQTVRDTVATAVFKASIESTDPDTLLSNIISELNKAVNSLKEPDNNSPGSSSAGNRDNSSNEISIGILNSETSTKNTFNDVAVSHWSFEAIEYLAKRGIINGKGNGNFAPSDSVKREEFIKMVIASLGVELSSADESFEDVSPDKWYAPYVATGVNLGIVNGISENLFGIDNNISRQDAATMLYRCREALNAGLVAERDYNKFNDSAQIGEYASEAVEYFYRCNVINGNENNCFAPLENLTRAQAAKMIYEIIR